MSFSFEPNDFFAGFAQAGPPDGCTQCAICLSTCPTYIKSEDHDQSPMGRIRIIRELENDNSEGTVTENIENMDKLGKLDKLESCLGCYTCELVCPSKVNFGKLLDESLALVRKQRPLSPITRMMLWMTGKTSFIKSVVKLTSLAQILGLRALMSKLGLFKLMGLQRANGLLGNVHYPGKLKNRIFQSHNDQPGNKQHVALFTGCFSSVLERDTQQASIDVLNALGLEVSLPKGQGCCGALHRHNGDLENAEKFARNNIQAFSVDKADVIITTSSGCGAGLKDYGEWLEGEELTTPVMDVSHYLAITLSNTLTNNSSQHTLAFNSLPLRVALHTPCTLRQTDGQEEAVIDLLQKIPGLEIVPLSGEPRCCGAGGSQMLSHPQMADSLRDDIVAEFGKMEADVLISSNLGCAMHLRRGLVQAGINIPLHHPVQLIAQALVV